MYRIIVSVAILAAVLLAAPAAQAQQGWGNIKGRIVWGQNDLPERKPIAKVNENNDKVHCLSKGPVLDEEWVVDKKTRGLQWTFIWLINDDPKDKTPLPVHPTLQKIKDPQVAIDQPICAFIPHALAMREGQVLVAKNSSPVSHNIKWTGAKNQGNFTLPAGTQKEIPLEAERLPMLVECNFHPWMNARVGIFTHPYFALTGPDGRFEIKNAPAGKYRIVVYNNFFLDGTPGRNGRQISIPPDGTLDLGEIAFTPPAPPKAGE
jgi:hypothetical protein